MLLRYLRLLLRRGDHLFVLLSPSASLWARTCIKIYATDESSLQSAVSICLYLSPHLFPLHSPSLSSSLSTHMFPPVLSPLNLFPAFSLSLFSLSLSLSLSFHSIYFAHSLSLSLSLSHSGSLSLPSPYLK